MDSHLHCPKRSSEMLAREREKEEFVLAVAGINKDFLGPSEQITCHITGLLMPDWKYFKDEYPQNPFKWIFVTDGKVVECKSAYPFVPRYEDENPLTDYLAWYYIPMPEAPSKLLSPKGEGF